MITKVNIILFILLLITIGGFLYLYYVLVNKKFLDISNKYSNMEYKYSNLYSYSYVREIVVDKPTIVTAIVTDNAGNYIEINNYPLNGSEKAYLLLNEKDRYVDFITTFPTGKFGLQILSSLGNFSTFFNMKNFDTKTIIKIIPLTIQQIINGANPVKLNGVDVISPPHRSRICIPSIDMESRDNCLWV